MYAALGDDELLELIILPLTVKGREEKQALAEKTVELAGGIQNEEQRIQALSGILTFADKIIDKEYAKRIKEAIGMNKVAQLFYDEGIEMGLAKGKADLIRCIRKKIKKGYAAIEIAEVLEIDVLHVKQIADLMQNYPEDTDVEIAARLLRGEKQEQAVQ